MSITELNMSKGRPSQKIIKFLPNVLHATYHCVWTGQDWSSAILLRQVEMQDINCVRGGIVDANFDSSGRCSSPLNCGMSASFDKKLGSFGFEIFWKWRYNWRRSRFFQWRHRGQR